MKKKPKLGLFFTKSISLKHWVESGLFDREKRIYEWLLENEHVERILWFTYGVNDDVLASELVAQKKLHKKILVVSMPKIYGSKIGKWFYSLFMGVVHFSTFRKLDILKTNQIYGSWAAIIIKIFMAKPLILRCGYIPTRNVPTTKPAMYFFRLVQRIAFKLADISVVSNPLDHEFVTERYNVDNVRINPSYVDGSVYFRTPNKNIILENKIKFLYVGRLEKVKNIINIIDAILLTGNTIDIYGDGSLRPYIQEKYQTPIAEKKVSLMGIVSNNELAKIYQRYDFYILMSLTEGMSKTLLEAMTSGLICVVSDIPQNTCMVVDGETGITVKGFTADAIKNKINHINLYNLQNISENAANYAANNFSLEVIGKNEIENINVFIR